MGESHPLLSNFARPCRCRLFFSCLVVIVEFVHKHDHIDTRATGVKLGCPCCAPTYRAVCPRLYTEEGVVCLGRRLSKEGWRAMSRTR